MSHATIIEASADDAERLAAFAAKTFIDTFGATCSRENIAAHVATHCTTQYFLDSLDAGDTVLMQMIDDTLIGYAKVGHVSLPVKKPAKGAQEIHRVYIDREFQGRGHGRALMLHILSLPRIQTAHTVYLGVWEHNIKAQSLYTQYGFKPVDHYVFYVGEQADTDLIMARVR